MFRATKEYLLSKVRHVSTGCWQWTGTMASKGYGTVGYGGKQYRVHRLFWKLYKGEIPHGLWVLHRCNNRACVNPQHLYLGTAKDNYADSVVAGTYPRGERHGNSKLTYEIVKEIRALKSNLVSPIVAAQFNIHEGQVRKIWENRAWRHVVVEEKP